MHNHIPIFDHKINNALTGIRNLGVLGWAGFQLANRIPFVFKLIGNTIWPHSVFHSLRIRSEQSDMAVFRQIYLHKELSAICPEKQPELIVDCGANVGYSAAYFLSRFPKSILVAIEPNPVTYQELLFNLSKYRHRVKCYNRGVWSHCCNLSIIQQTNTTNESWCCRVAETLDTGAETIKAIDIPTLLYEIGIDRIGLLKIDIEHAEKVLFGPTSKKWISKCDNIAIELHDEECERVFFNAIKTESYNTSKSGEYIVCQR